jgi:FlaA1/EpsC-like NDP-sugar epimerase
MRCGAAVGASTLLVWGLAPRMTAGRADASQFAIYALVAAGLVCGSRISYRLLQDQAWKASTAGQPVLIYGAGHAGIAAMRELQRNADWGLRPVGFLDDDPLLRGKTVSSLPVLGGFDLLESLVEKVGAQAIAIATAKIPSERVEEVRRTTERLSIALYRFEIGFQPESGEHPQEAVVSPRFP